MPSKSLPKYCSTYCLMSISPFDSGIGHTYNAIISASARVSISTRKSTCEPHKRKHKQACACVVVPVHMYFFFRLICFCLLRTCEPSLSLLKVSLLINPFTPKSDQLEFSLSASQQRYIIQYGELAVWMEATSSHYDVKCI